MKTIKVFRIVVIMVMAFVISSSDFALKSTSEDTISQTEFKLTMRKLWEDHVMWTRNVIFNIIDDLPGTENSLNRLLKNQDDIGNAIKPFYGDNAGSQLTSLLKTHITQAGDLLKAAKNGNDREFKKIQMDWQKNADDIAGFLAKANPNWTLADLKKMMREHLTLTTEEATARLNRDYAADVIAYDRVHDAIIMMSDALADGIIRQFPERFRSH